MNREEARLKAVAYFEKADIYLSEDEKLNLEIADMGLGNLETIGLQVHIYVVSDRYSAKEMVLLPGQICPEQRHPPYENEPGKEETFRIRYGELYLYTEGEPVPPGEMKAKIPAGKEGTFTVFHEIILRKGDQYTIPPNTTHWICGGPDGCVLSEFASRNTDDIDIYTDPAVSRLAGV